MSLIDKEDALQVGIVAIINQHLGLIFFKLLYIDHHYFKFTLVVLCNRAACNISHQFLTAFGVMNNKPTSSKLICGLFHKVDSVYNKIELGHNILLRKKVGKASHAIISESCFAATLRVPNNATFYAFIQSMAYGV